MSWLLKTVDFVLPPRCIITGDIVDQQGMISPKAWSELNFITDPFCQRCGHPFDFIEENSNRGVAALCGRCIKEPPQYDRARAALMYDDTSRDLILSYKHADQMHLVTGFLPWLRNAGFDVLKGADYLIPVPLHRWRILRRRFNQAALIAQKLGKREEIKVILDGLLRVRSTPTQGHLKEKERQKNVRNAFTVNPKHLELLKGKRVVLIDDVYTTGATVEECTKKLLKAGVSSVSILTLARVVKPNKVY